MTPIRAALLFAGSCGLLAVCACSEKDQGTGPGKDDVPPAFAASTECGLCHPDQLAEWESSRHAYSSADPVMHRLAEIAGEEIADACKQCHSPAQRRMERLLAVGRGDPSADFSDDGINCDVCHSISAVPPVGTIDFLSDLDPTGPKYANMTDPVDNVAHASERRVWYSSSIACASCHQFNTAGGTGLENTFIEWEATNLAGMGVECQSCHMPRYTGQAAVGGPVRDDLHRHHFVGPDYMYEPFRGVDFAQQEDDIRNLLENSVSVTVENMPSSVGAGSSFAFGIRVLNDRTGHSIPSGVSFAREMWIEVSVTDGNGGTRYRSGWLQPNDDLVTTADDPDLARFSSQMYDADDQPTGFAWEATRIDESGLLAFAESRTAQYTVDVPQSTPGPLTVAMALRFRSLAPGPLRDLGLHSLLPIKVFDMWKDTRQVAVTP